LDPAWGAVGVEGIMIKDLASRYRPPPAPGAGRRLACTQAITPGATALVRRRARRLAGPPATPPR
ncbi:hypothetical protein ACWECC_39385, partial [Streptomyces microflavus]